jgi:hypothetical protein
MNVKNAASYCGYNPKHFSRVVSGFKIPRHGPKRNRFKRSDLDEWMIRPSCFSQGEDTTTPRTGFQRVHL